MGKYTLKYLEVEDLYFMSATFSQVIKIIIIIIMTICIETKNDKNKHAKMLTLGKSR